MTRIALLLLACLALACQTAQGVIPPRYALQSGGDGIVIFSVDGGGHISLTRDETGESLSLEAVKTDFYALLPAGSYRAALTTGEGAHVRFYLVHLTVPPGVVSYAGSIGSRRAYSAVSVVEVADDYDAAVARFRAARPDLAGEGVLKSLADVRSCGSTGAQCDPDF